MMNDSPVTTLATLIDANGVRVVEFALSAQASGPWHHHSHVVEHCYGVRGAIVVEFRDRAPVQLGPGERCEIPAGVRHRLRNARAEESRYLVVQGVGAYDFVRADDPPDEATESP